MKKLTKKIIIISVVVVVLLILFSGGSKNENTKSNQLASITTTQDQNDIDIKPEIDEPKENEEKVIQAEETQREQKSELDIYYSVVKVVDGDTLSIDIDGQKQTLRLIGIDTPETVHPSKPVECFGREASAKAKEILTGQNIRIEKDTTQGDLDKYGRLLVYVFLKDGTNFNMMMIKQGFAYEYTYNLPYKYQQEFKLAEQTAREQKIGLWADNVCEEEVIEPSIKSTETPSKSDCSSNVYNCTDFKTHNEAQATYDYCGGVNNDIHRLDNDKDGEACESLP